MTGGSLYPSGRQRILAEDVTITPELGIAKQFRIKVDKSRYGAVPPDSSVRLIVRESSFQRHTINLKPWADLGADFTFSIPEHLSGRFSARFMVVSQGLNKLGLLVATCEGLHIDTGDGPNIMSGLLHSRYDPELDSYAWRFEIENGDRPLIALNQRLQEHPEFYSSGYFRGLILPEIVRRVLEWLLLEADPSEEDSFAHKWLNLLCGGRPNSMESFVQTRQNLHSQRIRGLDDASKQEVEQLVRSFCATHRPVDELIAELERP